MNYENNQKSFTNSMNSYCKYSQSSAKWRETVPTIVKRLYYRSKTQANSIIKQKKNAPDQIQNEGKHYEQSRKTWTHSAKK